MVTLSTMPIVSSNWNGARRLLAYAASVVTTRSARVRYTRDYAKERAHGMLRRHEIRDLLRAPASPAVDGSQRVPAPAGRARADRARRPARLRLRLVRRAPFPGGILALLGARGVPRRREPADEAD